MKTTTLTAQFENFVALYTKDKEERVRFFVFFAGAIQLIVFTLLNIVGTIGIYHPFLQTVSFALLALCVAMVTLYLRRTLSLVSAFATFAITAQLLEMARIAFLLFLTPPGYEAMVIYYQVGSYTILLYIALGFIAKVPLLVTALNIATLLCVTLYDGHAIDQQIALLFALLCIFTCALAVISRRGLHKIQQENKDYQDTHNSILTAFNMNQSELIAYLQICRAKEPNSKYVDMLLSQLNEQSKHNLVHAAMVLKKKHDAQQLELSKCFPSLTHTELEVSRLVVEGKTLGEIALIMGKTTTNISTVRGNVRKKLGLQPSEDLVEKLKELAAPANKALRKTF